jgi:hypothetical protein
MIESKFILRFFLVLAVVSAPPLTIAQESQSIETKVAFFESKIRPTLIEKCQSCHGPEKSWANLRLDSAESIAKGGESGSVLSPGNPDESELFRRITATDEDARMPPADSANKLSPSEIADLKQWIASGAHWPANALAKTDTAKHWAFQPITHPDPPMVEDAGAHPIDRFIAAYRAKLGISGAPQAERRTLIRRAYYGLLGLPPSHSEVEAFRTEQDPNAYEKLIDRLLLSPHYGEQWGRHWLDVARYSDTKGYVYAREEREFYHAAHFRDWVVNAFNEDMPFDRFVLLQLAADQAAPQEPKHLAAMGYLTLGRRFLGVESDIVDDKIDVVGRGILGLTIGCARCHDHKYDPIPTEDYYSLYGVFYSTIERTADLPRREGVAAPDEKYLAGLKERERAIQDLISQRRGEAEQRLRTRVADYLYAQRELEKYPDASFNTFTTKDEIIPGLVLRWEEFLHEAKRTGHTILGPWLLFAELKDIEFAEKAAAVCQQIAGDHKVHPNVAALFQMPPKDARDVADRYGKLFVEIEQKWQKAIADAKAANTAAPTALEDANEESLRQFLYMAPSPCVIPPESVGQTEWCWDLNTVVELWGKQADLDRWMIQGQESDPRTVHLVDSPHPITPRVFRRGNPASKQGDVPRQFLSVLAGAERKPFTQGSGRLELANAIVDPKNPLTARVWVNRVWHHHFGKGLVLSTSDFGLRASPPSHPELLDWLASEFIAQGWSNRWLHKTIMTSQAYQQGNGGPSDPAQLMRCRELDPENRLLWRMQTKRLSWEELRDTFIANSGELDDSIGGRSLDAFARSANGNFRRSIYNRVDRQYLPNVYSAFDFANPDLHSPQRSDTTVPQQALFLLNHPFVADRAKAIARNAVQGENLSKEAVIGNVFRAVLQREPTPTQLQSAKQFVEHAETESAAEVGKSETRLAPLEQFAQLLLISNEVLFVD